jgi:hypothetical protein
MYLCVVTGERIHPIHYANLGIEPGEFVPWEPSFESKDAHFF